MTTANVLGVMYNAVATSLTWGEGRSYMATGVVDFRCHFRPVSQSLAVTPFGARSSHQLICNYGLALRAGDHILLGSLGGTGVWPVRRFQVDGVQAHYHQYGLLSHMLLALSEYSSA